MGPILHGFSIRMRSIFSWDNCAVNIGFWFSLPCILALSLPFEGQFIFSFFAHRLSTFFFCDHGLIRFQSMTTSGKIGWPVNRQISPIRAARHKSGGTIIINQKLRQVAHRGRKRRIGRRNDGFQRDNWVLLRRFGGGGRMHGRWRLLGRMHGCLGGRGGFMQAGKRERIGCCEI